MLMFISRYDELDHIFQKGDVRMNGYVSVKEASHKWEIPEHGTNYGKSRENQKKRLIRASRNRMGGRQV